MKENKETLKISIINNTGLFTKENEKIDLVQWGKSNNVAFTAGISLRVNWNKCPTCQ